MNTPLRQLLRIAYVSLEGMRINRHHNDARNYKGPRDVPADEAADRLVKHLAGFTLDWRHITGELPAENTACFIAFDPGQPFYQPEVREAWHDHGVWFFSDGGGHVEGRVYAWAPMPIAPRPDQLVGFDVRPAAPR